ncbi:MAG: TolC family protein [Chitinophagales bacterium]
MKAFLFFILSTIANCAMAQSPKFLSLEEAIYTGLHQNYQVIIDSNNSEAAALNNSPGNAGFLPSLGLTGFYTYTDNNINQHYSNGTELNQNNAITKSTYASLGATWTLFDGGKMFATAKLLHLQENQSRTTGKENLQNLIANIMYAYYNVVQQKQLLVQIDSSLKYYDVQFNTARNLQNNGKGTRQQVLQSQIDRNAERSAYYNQLNALLDSKTNLNQFLQQRPDLDFEVIDSILLIANLNPDTTEQFLRRYNPSLIAADINAGIQTAILSQNRSLYFPQLDLTAGYEYNKTTSSASFFLLNQNQGWNAGLSLTYNLFDGFKTRNQVAISKINLQNANFQYRQVLSEIRASITNAMHKYQSAMEQMILLKENLELARENLQIALEEYKLYAITQIELQRAHKSFDDAGAAYITAAFAAKSAEINLLNLNGSLVQ